jgi:pimeloyl-ACP methyl ester carboxylesterase
MHEPGHRRVRSGEVTLSVHTAGSPGDPPIVLIHGYPDSHSLWDLVVPRLAEHHHVITYDVRGMGESTAPSRAAGYDLPCLAGDLAAVAAAVAPDRPVHLVGHDWGAVQGWEFVTAPRFAGQIASFTAVAGPALAHAAGPDGPGRSWAARLAQIPRLRRSWYIPVLCAPGSDRLLWGGVLGRARWEALLRREGARLDARYPAASLLADARAGAQLYRRNIARPLLSAPGARRLVDDPEPIGLWGPPRPAHAPVQLIVPARDRYIAPSYYDAAAAHTPQLRRRVIPGSHWAPRTEPERLAELIAQFAGASA